MFTTLQGDSAWTGPPFPNADDGSFGPIALPFTFQLYGQNWDSVYINVNGNISFGHYSISYQSLGFPSNVPAYPAMIAPFLADFDLSYTVEDTNLVSYKVTSRALYVTWTNAGYFYMQTDKVNSFQVIISDGTDPVIPGGNNVSFCYGNMQWTTGAASGGVDGFGGTPAVAGANAGDGTNYLQLGRFNHAGDDWNGPSGGPDGIGWLTGSHFSFSTASADISPIFIGIDCDTLDIQPGSSYLYPGWSSAGISPISASRSISLQPNPANDKVTVSWPAELRPRLIRVIATDGSLVMTRAPEIGATRMQLDVSSLAQGVYTVRLSGSSGVSTARLVR